MDGIAILDEEGRYVFVNQAHAEVYGFDRPDDLLGEDWRILYHDEALERFETKILPELERDGAWRGKAYAKRQDGSRFPQELSLTRIDDGGLICVVRDLSEAQTRELELERARENLERAEEVAQLGHWVRDLDRETAEWSDGFHRIHGVDPGSVEPNFESRLSLIHPEDRDRVRSTVRTAIQTATSTSFDYRAQPPQGGIRIIHNESRVELDANGRPVRWFGTAQDVTQRRREQERIEAYAEELERFNQIAAHDLKEPLRNIAGYVQLLERRYGESLDDEARDYIGFAVDAAQRLRLQINGIREYARVGGGNPRTDPVALDDCLEQALENLHRFIEEHEAGIETGCLPVVDANRHLVALVLQNLVENGIKFNENDAPHIRIEADTLTDRVVVSVDDDGIGIPEHHQGKLFRIFERLHGPEDYPGTGLGLAVCRRIVEAHGCEIWVTSQPGEGSTFCFTLPKPD